MGGDRRNFTTKDAHGIKIPSQKVMQLPSTCLETFCVQKS